MKMSTRFLAICISMITLYVTAAEGTKKPIVDADGTIHVPAFELPESSFLSDETRAALKFDRENSMKEYQAMDCPSFEGADMDDMPAIRQCRADHFYTSSVYKNMTKRYDVKISTKIIAGVYTEIFTPAEGVKNTNLDKVLINLHGGGFVYGSRFYSHLESIPISAVGQIKVVSIDYRMAPEYQFPAASEDVEEVYRELLKQYKPENIGVYGCSAGAILTAQSVAWFLDKGLPVPSAIGMFCMGAPIGEDFNSDGGIISAALTGRNMVSWPKQSHYVKGTEYTDVLAYPGLSLKTLRQFPPSLLISATRDNALSSVVSTHTKLRKLGVEADLVIWEGLGHAFHFNSEFQESREAYNIIVDFFDKHLGQQ